MKLESINEEHKIMSVNPEFLPEGLRGHTLILYSGKRDVIVMNTDAPLYDGLLEYVPRYLSLSDVGRKEAMESIPDTGLADELKKMHAVLNRIIRIRRKLHRNEKRTVKDTVCIDIELSENSGGGTKADLLLWIGVDI